LWLLNIDNAIYCTCVQSTQTEKFSALALNRSTNADVRVDRATGTRKKAHPHNLLHRSGNRGGKTNDVLAAAGVTVIATNRLENLNTCWSVQGNKYIALVRNQRIRGLSISDGRI